MTPKIITRAEREARRAMKPTPFANPGTPIQPIAQWRKKGCTTCKPIPVYSRQPAQPPLPTDHGHNSRPTSPA